MFKNVQVIIVDEFSMIQSDQLYQLHQRLCKIKQSDQPFANISIILLGDMTGYSCCQVCWNCQALLTSLAFQACLTNLAFGDCMTILACHACLTSLAFQACPTSQDCQA